MMNLVFAGRDSKNLILDYGKRGIIVAGGPACSSKSDEPSHVLQAIGVPENEINGAIRISFNPQTTREDIEAFINATKEILGEN